MKNYCLLYLLKTEKLSIFYARNIFEQPSTQKTDTRHSSIFLYIEETPDNWTIVKNKNIVNNQIPAKDSQCIIQEIIARSSN